MYTLTSMPFLLSFDCPKLLSLHGPLPSALPYQLSSFVHLTCRPPVHLPAPFPSFAHSVLLVTSVSLTQRSLSFVCNYQRVIFSRNFIFSRTANILQLLHLFQSLMWQTCLTSHRTFWNSLVQDWYSSKPCLWFQSNVVGHPQPT